MMPLSIETMFSQILDSRSRSTKLAHCSLPIENTKVLELNTINCCENDVYKHMQFMQSSVYSPISVPGYPISLHATYESVVPHP